MSCLILTIQMGMAGTVIVPDLVGLSCLEKVFLLRGELAYAEVAAVCAAW